MTPQGARALQRSQFQLAATLLPYSASANASWVCTICKGIKHGTLAVLAHDKWCAGCCRAGVRQQKPLELISGSPMPDSRVSQSHLAIF